MQYQIRSDLTATLDSYHEGQDLQPLAEWTEEHTIEAPNPVEAVKTHYHMMGHDLNFDSVDGHKLYVSLLVDTDYNAPTAQEIEEWKQDKKILCTLDIVTQVYDLVETEL